MKIGDIRPAHRMQVFLLHGLVEEARNQLLDHFLADVAGETGLHQAERSLAGTESRQFNFSLNPGDGPLGFFLDFRGGNRDLERMLAAFD